MEYKTITSKEQNAQKPVAASMTDVAYLECMDAQNTPKKVAPGTLKTIVGEEVIQAQRAAAQSAESASQAQQSASQAASHLSTVQQQIENMTTPEGEIIPENVVAQVADNKAGIEELNDITTGIVGIKERVVDFATERSFNGVYVAAQKKWLANASYKFVLVSTGRYKIFEIQKGAGLLQYCMLKSDNIVSGEDLPFSEGKGMVATTGFINIPDDCKYLLVAITTPTEDRTPSLLRFVGVEGSLSGSLERYENELYLKQEDIITREYNTAGNWVKTYLDKVIPAGTRVKVNASTVFYFYKHNSEDYILPLVSAGVSEYVVSDDVDTIGSNMSGTMTLTYTTPETSRIDKLIREVGNLSNLNTSNKTSLVDAINELSKAVNGGGLGHETIKMIEDLVEEIKSIIYIDGEKEVTETYMMLGQFQRTALKSPIPAGTRIYNFSGAGAGSFYFWDSDNKYITPLITSQTTEYILPKDAYSVGNNAGGEVTFSYIVADGKVNRFDEIETAISMLEEKIGANKEIPAPEIICPDTLYAVIGNEFNLYYDSLFCAMDAGLNSPFGYYVDIRCRTLWKIGIRHDRFWQIAEGSLTSSHIGNHTIDIVVYDSNNNIVAEKTVTLKVVNSDAIGSGKNILLLGDSITNNGRIPQYVSENFVANGGVAPILVGSREKWGYRHEGWPGYSTHDFTSNTGRNYYIFQVPISLSVAVGDQYSCQGNVYKIEDLREETDTTQSVRTSLVSGSANIPASGTITWVSGSQASAKSIDYTEFEVQDANPLWDAATNKVNITAYRNKLGITSQLDAVVIMLGVNDALVGYTDGAEHLRTIVDAILLDSPNCKIIVQMPTEDANTVSSWHAYQDVTYSKKMRYKSFLWKLRKSILNEFRSYKANVFVGQAYLGIDRYYGYPNTNVAIGKRITTTEILHTNSVHPSDEGYHQLADSYYLQLKSIL